MSKVNRRKEIKEKENFQLRFQLALSASNANVSSWLPASREVESINTASSPESKHSFLDLPVISNGASLSELDRAEKSTSHVTIGSFLGSENAPTKSSTSSTRDIRTGSKAMSALMNKMRNDSRKNLTDNKVGKEKRDSYSRSRIMEDMKRQKQNLTQNDLTVKNTAEESDEEESKMKQISSKAKAIPQFGKKAKGRPF